MNRYLMRRRWRSTASGGGSGTPNFTALPALSRQVPDASLFASRRALSAGTSFTDPTTGAKVIKLTDSTTDSGALGVGVANYSEGGPYISRRWGTNSRTVHLGGEFVEFNDSTGAIIRRASMPSASSTCVAWSMNPATPRRIYYAQGSRIFAYDTETNAILNLTYIPTAGREMRYDLGGAVGDEFYIEWFTMCEGDNWMTMQANNRAKVGSLYLGIYPRVNDYFCFFSPLTGAVVANTDPDNNQLHPSRDGSSALLATNSQGDTRIFRRATNDVQVISTPNGGHPAALTGVWLDVQSVGALQTTRWNLSTLDATVVNTMDQVRAQTGTHHSGHYYQPSAGITQQYLIGDSYGSHPVAPTGGTWTLVSGQKYSKAVDWSPNYLKPNIGVKAVLQYTTPGGKQTFTNTLALAASAAAVSEGTYFYDSATETVTLWQVGGGTPSVRLYAAAGNMMGVAAFRADGNDARLVCHHGNDIWLGFSSAVDIYERYAFSTWSPDGLAVLFRSTFGVLGGRADWYVAMLPETP